jgi:geranylgeranyl diphosphate synthase, type II
VPARAHETAGQLPSSSLPVIPGPVKSKIDLALAEYRELVLSKLLADLPSAEPTYLYELVQSYPSRPAKGLRSALCLAVCAALGGDPLRALNSAVAIELFHNAFLIHDDVQDQSERRRSGPALHVEHGIGVALNVGNMTNLIALNRLFNNRWQLGPSLTWRIFQETELMMRHSLEGQAIELGWIRDNACDLVEDDYYRMCLKKTSWYTCIYPCRVGALVARNGDIETARFDRFGWYLGAAFQIQDDILNLVGDYDAYGKEIGGDLWEGKRTLMLINLMRILRGSERRRVERFLAQSRLERRRDEVEWLRGRIIEAGCIDQARAYAQQLSVAAHEQALKTFRDVADSDARNFLLALPSYVLERDR